MTTSIRTNVYAMIRTVLEKTLPLVEDAPAHFKDRVWLYRRRTGGKNGEPIFGVTALDDRSLERPIKLLVSKYGLVDSNGKPLKVNVSRLRKTFVNRIYDILDGDLATTSAAAGNTPQVAGSSYLRAPEESERNWKFMGNTLTQELLSGTVGETYKTPVAQCSDNKNGEYAPKRDGAVCMSFLNCLRCRHMVVTGDDLYRLFSLYWRVLRERARMQRSQWKRRLGHIVRLIEEDVIKRGLELGHFSSKQVQAERERARNNPHPFWSTDTIISDLTGVSS